MSDLLEQATRALRETTAESQPRSGLTRARLLDSAEKRYTPKRGAGSLLRWSATLFAALAASTAFAHIAQYWPEIKRAIAPESVEHSEAAPAKRNKQAKKPAQPLAAEQPLQPSAADPAVVAPQEVPAAAPAADAPGVPAASSATPAPRPKPAARKPKSAARPAIESEPVAPVPVAPAAAPAPPVLTLTPAPETESADLALFRRAQRLHLNRDPRALAAWDDYLRVAGSGPLAPEARYNRALCLVRAGRKPDAKAALTPFANGAYGTYRQTEAAALIKALEASN